MASCEIASTPLDEFAESIWPAMPRIETHNAKRGSDGLDKCPQMRTLVVALVGGGPPVNDAPTPTDSM